MKKIHYWESKDLLWNPGPTLEVGGTPQLAIDCGVAIGQANLRASVSKLAKVAIWAGLVGAWRFAVCCKIKGSQQHYMLCTVPCTVCNIWRCGRLLSLQENRDFTTPYTAISWAWTGSLWDGLARLLSPKKHLPQRNQSFNICPSREDTEQVLPFGKTEVFLKSVSWLMTIWACHQKIWPNCGKLWREPEMVEMINFYKSMTIIWSLKWKIKSKEERLAKPWKSSQMKVHINAGIARDPHYRNNAREQTTVIMALTQ